MAKYMIYTDWENVIGYTENKLDWEVGDFTVVQPKKDGKNIKVMVYANFELDKMGLEVMKFVFKKHHLTNKFHEDLNSIIEEFIHLNKINFGEEIVKEREIREAERDMRGYKRNMKLLDALMNML